MKALKNHITIVVITSLLMYIAVALDISFFRQIIAFFYLVFIPGFIFLKILKLDELRTIDKILLSIGLSIALLMFIGFFTNALYPIIGISEPLSTLPLILTLGIITAVLAIISYYRNNKSSVPASLIKPSKFFPRALLLTFIPVLAIFGALFNNSTLLVLMIAIIAILIITIALSKKLISSQLYPIIIIIIAVSLLFHFSLISKYLTGWDVFLEVYVYNVTKFNSFWNPNIVFNPATLNGMLSITILPTIFSNISNIQGEWVFKIIYPLLFSFVPLTLFRTWEKQTGKLVAFLAAFFFMFSPKFYDTSEMRQVIAELFLALLLYLIVNKKIPGRKRVMLSVVFGAALVISHYSTSYIFLFTIGFAWFFSYISKNVELKSRGISSSFVLLLFVMAFFWYTYVSSAPLNALGGFVNNIMNSFSIDFFNLASRGGSLYAFTNPLSAPSFLYLMGNLVAKIPYLFIVIGFLGLFVNRIKNNRTRFDREYVWMITANTAILFAVIVVPQFGPGLVTTRFFHLTLFLLAPLCIVGGETFFKAAKKIISMISGKTNLLKKIKAISLVTIVLVTVFLFKTGFLYEVAGDIPSSPSLSKTRMEMSNNTDVIISLVDFYVPEQDVFSAVWMSKIINQESIIYADDISKLKVLVGYGMINPKRIYKLNENVTIYPAEHIYLRYENIIYGQLRNVRFETERTEASDISEISSLLTNVNKIYSNGFSEVYQSYKFLNMTEK